MRKSIAIGSTVVELTMSIAAVFVFVLTGVILFALHVNNHNLIIQLGLGLMVSLAVIAALVIVQRIGFFVLFSRLFRLMFKDKWADMVGGAARFDRAVTVIYYRIGRVAACGLMQLAAWSLGSVEVWLALHFLGHALPLVECVMLEALIQGSASAAFAVPGALGVQEAGFLIFGGMLGLPREVAAALAVMRRCRDLLLYVPGLVAWQVFEGKKLLR
jgi:putative membrane protein